jgi:hypothetical protein
MCFHVARAVFRKGVLKMSPVLKSASLCEFRFEFMLEFDFNA